MKALQGFSFRILKWVAGAMLVFLGLYSFFDLFVFHFHPHEHGLQSHSHLHVHLKSERHSEIPHAHRHVFGIGIIHGLASNDELLLLFAASFGVASLGLLLLGVFFFSIGVVLGMVVFSFLFSLPLVRLHSQKFYLFVSVLVGCLSVLYGLQVFL